MYAEKDIINHNNVNLCKILLLHKILLSYSVFIYYHLCLFIVTNLTSYFAHCVKCREETNCSNKGDWTWGLQLSEQILNLLQQRNLINWLQSLSSWILEIEKCMLSWEMSKPIGMIWKNKVWISVKEGDHLARHWHATWGSCISWTEFVDSVLAVLLTPASC